MNGFFLSTFYKKKSKRGYVRQIDGMNWQGTAKHFVLLIGNDLIYTGVIISTAWLTVKEKKVSQYNKGPSPLLKSATLIINPCELDSHFNTALSGLIFAAKVIEQIVITDWVPSTVSKPIVSLLPSSCLANSCET